MNIAVVGTGYVGLVTGTCFAETGNHVICVDIDKKKVERMRKGEIPIYEPGLDEVVKEARGRNLFFTTEVSAAIKSSDMIFSLYLSFGQSRRPFREGTGGAHAPSSGSILRVHIGLETANGRF